MWYRIGYSRFGQAFPTLYGGPRAVFSNRRDAQRFLTKLKRDLEGVGVTWTGSAERGYLSDNGVRLEVVTSRY